MVRCDGALRPKAATKTTEFFIYLAMVAALLIAAAIVDQPTRAATGARQAWLYVTILTDGYLVSRGLAKSGSRDPYTDAGPGAAAPGHGRVRR